MEEVAKFTFVGMAAVSFFAFLTISHWISTVAAERRDRERLGLLKRAAEQTPEAADRLRDLLREEDARAEKRTQRRALRARRDGLQGGMVLLAVGTGISIFLRAIVPDKPVWTLGIMIILVGIVIAVFALFEAPIENATGNDGAR